jgi:hypothetical protein
MVKLDIKLKDEYSISGIYAKVGDHGLFESILSLLIIIARYCEESQ